MAYDFSTLAPADFEDLSRELLGLELGIRFEAFAAGPDDGIDGRHAQGPDDIILQAKHWRGSTFAALKSVMARERAAVNRLAPARYILTTSRSLTPKNKRALAESIGPSLQSEADILGPDDLNQLLRKFPDIEKAHIKLWLSGTAMLERVLYQAQHAFTAITLDEIRQKVRIYAQNPSFLESKTILDQAHVLIISGPPGVGKTTLGEMLAYAYAGEGWEIIPIRSLDDGFAFIDDTKRRVYFFDDFLGRIALDAKALTSRDNDLARFMKRIRTSPNARFILTTRAYIYEEARRASEALSDKRLDISRYVLDVGQYTRRIRARILYNHLEVAGIGPAYIAALINTGALKKIVDHKNYSPRVVEWMTDQHRTGFIDARDYADAFLQALDHPHDLWDHAFRHRSRECQHLLFALFFCSEFGTTIEELRRTFDALHAHLSALYGHGHRPKDFEEALRVADGGFIHIRDRNVSFINPSLRDYLASYLNDIELLVSFAAISPSADWSVRVWRHGTQSVKLDEHKRLALAFSSVAQAFANHPVYRRKEGPPVSYEMVDIALSRRIEVLVEWFADTELEGFLDAAIDLTDSSSFNFSAWRDGDNLVSLAQEVNYPVLMEDSPKLAELRERVEHVLIEIIDSGIGPDDLETISDTVDGSRQWLSPAVKDAVERAIIREFEDIRQTSREIDSESTLQDYASALEKLAGRAPIPSGILASALHTVKDRMEEIAEEVSVAPAPAVRGASAPAKDIFDDAALLSLFLSLTA